MNVNRPGFGFLVSNSNSSILLQEQPDAFDRVLNDQGIKAGVPHIRLSHRLTPPSATPALGGDPDREQRVRMGHLLIWESDAKTKIHNGKQDKPPVQV